MKENKQTIMYVVRHGETQWNKLGRMQGWLDSNLTEAGISQAHAVAVAVKELGIKHIFSSDLGRAFGTARIIATKLGLSVHQDERLRERNLGIGQGLTMAEFSEKYPDESRRFFSGDPDYIIPDGESIRQRHNRSWQGAEEICHANVGSTILIVAHGGTLTSMFNHAVGLEPASPRSFSLFNSSINRFTIENDNWLLDTWGDISHLINMDSPISLQRYV